MKHKVSFGKIKELILNENKKGRFYWDSKSIQYQC